MKWDCGNVDFRRANYYQLVAEFDNCESLISPEATMSTQAAKSYFRRIGKQFGAKTIKVVYYCDIPKDVRDKIIWVYTGADGEFKFRTEIDVPEGTKRQFIYYEPTAIFKEASA